MIHICVYKYLYPYIHTWRHRPVNVPSMCVQDKKKNKREKKKITDDARVAVTRRSPQFSCKFSGGHAPAKIVVPAVFVCLFFLFVFFVFEGGGQVHAVRVHQQQRR